MKNYLFLALLFICGTAFGQYPYNTNIEPNLDKNVKYAQVSENNVPKQTGKRYASKGQFKSVTADVFMEQYLGIPVFDSGVYDPEFSDSTNISAWSVNDFFWQRIGGVLFVSGDISIDAINDTIDTSGLISLPTELSGYTLSGGAGCGVESNSSTLSQGCILKEDSGLIEIQYNPKLNSISTSKSFHITFIGNIE